MQRSSNAFYCPRTIIDKTLLKDYAFQNPCVKIGTCFSTYLLKDWQPLFNVLLQRPTNPSQCPCTNIDKHFSIYWLKDLQMLFNFFAQKCHRTKIDKRFPMSSLKDQQMLYVVAWYNNSNFQSTKDTTTSNKVLQYLESGMVVRLLELAWDNIFCAIFVIISLLHK